MPDTAAEWMLTVYLAFGSIGGWIILAILANEVWKKLRR